MIKNGTMSKSSKPDSLCLVGFCMALVVCLTLPLGSQAADKLKVMDSTGDNTVFVVTDQGQVGINALDGGTNSEVVMKVGSSTSGVPIYYGVRSGGSLSTPSATPSGKGLFWLGAMGHGSTGWTSLLTGLIGFWSTENWTDTANGTEMRFFTTPNGSNARAERMRIAQNGRVGIGVTAPSALLHLAGGAYSNGTTWVNASSREYKENINTLSTEDALDTLKGLTPVTFVYKKDVEAKHVGFIAEDVPDLVATKDRKGLSSMDIVAVLTKVVQEQQKTIEELNAKVEELNKEVKLKNGFALLEK